MIVVDASALIALLLDEPQGLRRLLNRRFNQSDESLHAPHILDLEVAHTLRRKTLQGTLAPDLAQLALTRLATVHISRYPHTGLLDRVWQLRNHVSAYDAAYVALSETLDAPLITMDRRLANASGHHARVEVF